ncbi:uncharacterized protein LOC126888397 [Diabrotica virgifera virgifera]|uniref:MULE transposase domain-containing protein n=1 Tax=Diabrotica virgifera virgifera TaxID=50390 RepID=A0ABM5KQX2_DIAVI|nr:uncharacterized protein LOC126888397 [Diabrotica virgifera virgifera]
MNKAQREMLEKYGSDCICIDGTHGLNSYEFELITLLILDDMREGFPCAFCISNRTDEVAMKIFFSCIKEKLGTNVQSNVFMSDMAQSFYNAWVQVMGPVELRLFCSWHVDRAWRKNLNKVKSKDKQVEVYKQLRTLLQERDINCFHQMCHNFVTSLLANSDTLDFGVYFQEQYLKNVNEWAYCYRIHSGINTNMHLESMHRTLKYIYLNGKVVQRLDKCIHILMKFVRDKIFERVIVIHKGKISTKIRNLRSRHKASLTLDENMVLETSSGWQVQSSSSSEVYTVEKKECNNCKCKLICSDCKACLHQYTCTCLESSIKWNMCKHIHLVCRILNKHQITTEENPDLMTQELDNALLVSEDVHDNEERKLIETLISKKKEIGSSLDDKKVQVKAELISIIDSITSNEQLEALQRLMAPIRPTLAAIEKQHIQCTSWKSCHNLPKNKNIPQQRRLYKTKKSNIKKNKILAKPGSEESNRIAQNLLYPV